MNAEVLKFMNLPPFKMPFQSAVLLLSCLSFLSQSWTPFYSAKNCPKVPVLLLSQSWILFIKPKSVQKCH